MTQYGFDMTPGKENLNMSKFRFWRGLFGQSPMSLFKVFIIYEKTSIEFFLS